MLTWDKEELRLIFASSNIDLEVPHEPHVGVEHDLVHKVGPSVTVGWTGPLRACLLGRGVPTLIPNLQ